MNTTAITTNDYDYIRRRNGYLRKEKEKKKKRNGKEKKRKEKKFIQPIDIYCIKFLLFLMD